MRTIKIYMPIEIAEKENLSEEEKLLASLIFSFNNAGLYDIKDDELKMPGLEDKLYSLLFSLCVKKIVEAKVVDGHRQLKLIVENL